MSKILDPFSIPAQLNNLGVLIVAYVAKKINEYVRAWNVEGFRSGFMLHNLDWLRGVSILLVMM